MTDLNPADDRTAAQALGEGIRTATGIDPGRVLTDPYPTLEPHPRGWALQLTLLLDQEQGDLLEAVARAHGVSR